STYTNRLGNEKQSSQSRNVSTLRDSTSGLLRRYSWPAISIYISRVGSPIWTALIPRPKPFVRRNSCSVSRKSRKIRFEAEESEAAVETARRSGSPSCKIRRAGMNHSMKISSKAPCRVDLAGGTLDIWPLYLYHANAVTLNFAVDRYASCMLESRADSRIVLRSSDLGAEEVFSNLPELRAARSYKFPLAAYLVKFFAPASGVNLFTNSEAPAGAGISGSSTLIIAIASALNKFTGVGYRIEKLREIAQNIEAQIIRVPTGAQDYYPAMYGGLSAIELSAGGIVRKAIPVDSVKMNERIVLAYTGEPRNSGINNWEVTKAHIDGDSR